MNAPKLLDVIAILSPITEHNLPKGTVGTIVEVWAEGVFEVEFANPKGETIATAAVKLEDLLVLHFNQEKELV